MFERFLEVVKLEGGVDGEFDIVVMIKLSMIVWLCMNIN